MHTEKNIIECNTVNDNGRFSIRSCVIICPRLCRHAASLESFPSPWRLSCCSGFACLCGHFASPEVVVHHFVFISFVSYSCFASLHDGFVLPRNNKC